MALASVFLVASLVVAGCQSEAGSSADPFDGEPWTLSGPELKIGSLDDPEYVFGAVGMAQPGPDGFVYSLHPRDPAIRRWTADGAPAGTVGRQGEGPGEFTQPGRMGFREDGFGGFFSIQPFQDVPLFANLEDGLLVVDRRAWTGDGRATVKVTRLDLAGDTLLTSSFPYTPVPLPSERVDSVVRAATERFGRFPQGDVRDATYRPRYLPPLSGMVVGRDGTLWLRHFDPFQSGTGEWLYAWWVLDADGSPLTQALVPARLRILTVTPDMVWGVERDELDVEYIVRYRLVKGG